MPSLSERLKALGVHLGAQDLPPLQHRTAWPVEDVVPGRFKDTSGGPTYMVENLYPVGFLHGDIQLGLQLHPNLIASWSGDPAIATRELSSYLFLDTETSGLAGGTGTYTFMVGAGRYTEKGFQLVQFFMRDPLEEPALLLCLEEFIHPCKTLVTFNGKSFDIPLLNTRYVLQGWKSPFTDLAHIDLLHLSRRIWRDRLQSRTLTNLEVHILGAHRTEEEVPGWMIPQLYFDYLRDGDARPLKRVFYHNAMDVVSMAALLNHATTLTEAPGELLSIDVGEMAAVARLYDELGQLNRSIQLYKGCLASPAPDELFIDTSNRLGRIFKHQADYPSAISVWKVAANLGSISACEELAKYYEHHAQDYPQAIHWTQSALQFIQKSGSPATPREQLQMELEHRLKRLNDKLTRQSG